MINPLVFYADTNAPIKVERPTLVEVHISDLHFGAFDPKEQFNILVDQFLNKILPLRYDLLAINGDIWDHKFMANSEVISYGLLFIDKLICDARAKGATLLILKGTDSHDADQLKLFYRYLSDPTVDVRIVETLKYEYVKGKKILCIPELYGASVDEYNYYLHWESYDGVCMHGTVVGSVFGADRENLSSPTYPVFDINSFSNCKGPIIAGHVHVPGCYQRDIYYCGSPLRYKYGEEEDKGFIILCHNLETGEYYTHFNVIESYKYSTINMDDMLTRYERDPRRIIEYVNGLIHSGIHNVRMEFTIYNEEVLNLLEEYYRTNSHVAIKKPNAQLAKIVQEQETQTAKYDSYNYIFDPKLTPQQVLTQYINQQKGFQYITTEELLEVLKGL